MRSGTSLVVGIVLGAAIVLTLFSLPRAFGQGMTGPMGSMMGQMMGPQAMGTMMGQMMQDPELMRSMAAACAQAMKDPEVLRNMQDAMDDPQMRQMMEQMLNMMRRR